MKTYKIIIQGQNAPLPYEIKAHLIAIDATTSNAVKFMNGNGELVAVVPLDRLLLVVDITTLVSG